MAVGDNAKKLQTLYVTSLKKCKRYRWHREKILSAFADGGKKSLNFVGELLKRFFKMSFFKPCRWQRYKILNAVADIAN
jgi:hypothetical protein